MEDKKIWEKHAKEWGKNPFYSRETTFIKWLLEFSKQTDKILDQGCGIGQYALSIYRLGFKNVIGLDFSEKLLKIAKKNASNLNYDVEFVKGDIRKMPFKKNSFDVVISAGIVEHVPETEKAVSELSRVIKKNKYLFISVPHKLSTFTLVKIIQKIFGMWKCGYEKSFTKKYFSKLLEKNGFEIQRYFLNEFGPGKHKIIGKIIQIIDKPLYFLGFGGHQMHFLAKKIK